MLVAIKRMVCRVVSDDAVDELFSISYTDRRQSSCFTRDQRRGTYGSTLQGISAS